MYMCMHMYVGGFLKLDSSDIRPISIGMPTIMVDDRLTDGASHGGKKNSGFNSAAEALASNSNSKTPHENPFLQFLSNSWYVYTYVRTCMHVCVYM